MVNVILICVTLFCFTPHKLALKRSKNISFTLMQKKTKPKSHTQLKYNIYIHRKLNQPKMLFL